MFEGGDLDPAKLVKIDSTFKLLDTMLEGKEFAAGDNLTLADLTLVASVSTFDAVEYDISKYKNVASWYQKVKATAPGYKELNEANVKMFADMAKRLLK